MRTGSFAIVLTLIASSLLCAQQDGQTQEQVFRSALKAVAVYVTVSDNEGHLVPDLAQDDFEVYDNGKKQEITLFDNGVQPITLVMMLDRSGSMVGNSGWCGRRPSSSSDCCCRRQGAHRQLCQPHPGRSARIHQQPARSAARSCGRNCRRPGRRRSGMRSTSASRRSCTRKAAASSWCSPTASIDPMGSNNISYHDVEKNAEQEDVMIFAVGLATPALWRRRRARHGSAAGAVAWYPAVIRPPPEEPKVDGGLPQDCGGDRRRVFRTEVDQQSRSDVQSHRRRTASSIRAGVHSAEARRQDAQTRGAAEEPDLMARARKTYVGKVKKNLDR